MKSKVILIVILALGCGKACELLGLLPTVLDFDLHVDSVVFQFERVLEDFVLLQEEYNHHLFEDHPGTTEELYTYMARCDRKSLKNSNVDTTKSAIERLDILDEKIDALVDCAWDFEQSFSIHYNDFHGVWHVEWAKFYSPVPDSLRSTPATYIPCVEENLAGVTGFIYALRLDFDEHLESYH